MTMGEKIASLRKVAGMTQRQLADRMGVTDKAVSKWERNLSCPDIESIPLLAEIFGISADELINTKATGTSEKDKIIDIVFKAVPMAMGVGLVVLAFMKSIDIYSGFSMAGIAIAVMGLDNMRKGRY
ncbi:MAG: helix-turn-helix transcriptional regulator [Oscillospiraceae bacterium]|nr:helix-turn-helix transcriptional regulator [Oscillospiraceae bacterium]